MYINDKFCLKFVRTHNTVSHSKIAQSTELAQHVKQCVLAILKRDKLVFWTPRFSLLDFTLSRLDSTFWLDSTLKLYYARTGRGFTANPVHFKQHR